MPYKDADQRREYQRTWKASRRAEWFSGKSCEQCGSMDQLELDHIDPDSKVDHKIWSWSKERREAELSKCRALCKDCHDSKSATERAKGIANGSAKLNPEKVREIRASSLSYRILASLYGVTPNAIRKIKIRQTWSKVP